MMRKRSALAICLSFCLLSLSLAAEIGARSKDAKGSQSKDGAVKSRRRGSFAWFERKEVISIGENSKEPTCDVYVL
jgi:hypothetical protein